MTSPIAPAAAPPPYSAPPPRASNGLAVAALVVGIVAFLLGWIPVLGLLAGVGAIVLGLLALRRIGGRGPSIIGLVLGGIATLTSLVTTLVMIAAVASGASGSTAAAGVVDAPAAEATEPAQAAAVAAPSPATTTASDEAAAADEAEEPDPADGAEEPVVDTPSAGAEYGGYPKSEARFVKIVQRAGDDYSETSNELKGAKVLAARDADACRVTSGTAKSWVGTIHDVGATGDGDGYVEIEIASNIVVQTWNNSFSDAFDDTLISPSARFYDRLADMEEGDAVVFSGRFVASDESCLDTTNLTKTFNAADPDFLFDFTNIRAQ